LGVPNTALQNDYIHGGFAGVATNGWGQLVFIMGKEWVSAPYPINISGLMLSAFLRLGMILWMDTGEISFGLDCVGQGKP